jgi:hypothetical protein
VPGHFSTLLGLSSGFVPGSSGYVRIASLMSASVTSFVIMHMKILLMFANPPFACSRVQKPQAWSDEDARSGRADLGIWSRGVFQFSWAASRGERRLKKYRAPEGLFRPRVV